MKTFKEKLYNGLEVIVDYESSNDLDLIDWFEEQSMFEGFATITSFDDDCCFIDGCDCAIQLEYIITYDELD